MMRFYPQLLTGAPAQFPLERRRSWRSVVNHMAGGHTVKYFDAASGQARWTLHYSGLTEQEAFALQTFFSESEGRLQGFTFVDPAGNLLRWSESLTQAIWTKDPLLQLTESIADPEGGTTATRITNTAQAPQTIDQALAIAANRTYCMSVSLRSAVPAAVKLRSWTTGSAHAVDIPVAGAWNRVWMVATPGTTEESVRFGLELPAGAVAEVYGFQVEAQPDPGGYKKTFARGGVYPDCRFDQDELVVMAEGLDDFGTTLRITTKL